MNSGTSITFYGRVHEIGGNKFLIEDKGTKIFDFGMQMGKVNQYFGLSRKHIPPKMTYLLGVKKHEKLSHSTSKVKSYKNRK